MRKSLCFKETNTVSRREAALSLSVKLRHIPEPRGGGVKFSIFPLYYTSVEFLKKRAGLSGAQWFYAAGLYYFNKNYAAVEIFCTRWCGADSPETVP